MNTQPLVSCVCVTRGKPDLLQRAIRCFWSQTYANKELIILYETNDDESALVVASLLQEPLIRSIAISHSPKLTLGELRNKSIQQCQGEYFCQWDDDDWYHPRRLEFQFNAIRQTGLHASALTHWLLFDARTDNVYCSHYRIWEGSIMCKTSVALTQIKYPPYYRGEDTRFITELYAQHGICHLPLPMLYVYTYTGLNTWDYDHFKRLFEKGHRLSDRASTLIKQMLQCSSENPRDVEFLTSDTFISELDQYIYQAVA
ncbi:glycosyltransferase family 2 protein [Spirosoma linguale]|uniref:Glycosyl transferase family 2 n=1 Tax=Spirosoma linguale (strain ATCC 33905 / DSM 74 / LMG 10896 / Claus 1) TaxID=504472 RepID=D2QI57_SPILD|nr:glycosyl transferase family 2 [Spirosoma linguale DSM 74]